MTGIVRVDPRAADELEEAAEWYDARRVGLGRELVLEVQAGVRAVAQNPLAGSLVDSIDPSLGVRRVHVRRFPYQVVYLSVDGDIVVIAVAHDRRRPVYWARAHRGGGVGHWRKVSRRHLNRRRAAEVEAPKLVADTGRSRRAVIWSRTRTPFWVPGDIMGADIAQSGVELLLVGVGVPS